MAASYPGPYNVHIEGHQGLVVDFARNVKDFPVARYTQVIPTTKLNDKYTRMTVEEAGRVLNVNGDANRWADGTARPERNEGGESFEHFNYRCERFQYGAPLGDLTIENADWDIVQQYQSIYARQAMTFRTQFAINVFTTSGNYAASHYIDVQAISSNIGTTAGSWQAATSASPNIQISLLEGSQKILNDTLAAVDLGDLVLVINDELAAMIAVTQEIRDYIKGSPEAAYFIKGDGQAWNPNSMYGLPPALYGFPLVIEKTRKVTTAKGASSTTISPVLPTATPFLCARPGGLTAPIGPNFSTVAFFAHTEMGVENVRDSLNKREFINIIEILDTQMVAPASGVLFYNVV